MYSSDTDLCRDSCWLLVAQDIIDTLNLPTGTLTGSGNTSGSEGPLAGAWYAALHCNGALVRYELSARVTRARTLWERTLGGPTRVACIYSFSSRVASTVIVQGLSAPSQRWDSLSGCVTTD